jgi:hypothetical protein
VEAGNAAGRRKNVKIDLPTVDNPKKKDTEAVMDAFLPAYRAIKDSFDKRPFWHWFTQHDRYVMERDTMGALKGLMMSLTQQTTFYVDVRLKAYREDDTMWLEALSQKDRKNILDAVRRDNSLSIEDAVEAVIKEKQLSQVSTSKIQTKCAKRRETGE